MAAQQQQQPDGKAQPGNDPAVPVSHSLQALPQCDQKANEGQTQCEDYPSQSWQIAYAGKLQLVGPDFQRLCAYHAIPSRLGRRSRGLRVPIQDVRGGCPAAIGRDQRIEAQISAEPAKMFTQRKNKCMISRQNICSDGQAAIGTSLIKVRRERTRNPPWRGKLGLQDT